MIPILANIVTALVTNNLPKVAQAVVDKGLDYVEEKTGIKIEPDENGNISAEKIAELKLAAMKHDEFRMEVVQKILTSDNENTESARKMQIAALAQDDVFSKRFPMYFASAWSAFTMLYLAGITFMTIPEANTRVVDTVTGFLLGTLIATVINFFFGSSRGSEMKNDIIAWIKGGKNATEQKLYPQRTD